MIERVVENWLSNVAERDFQVPYAQVLALQSYQIVHLSVHGPFEQGKDVIAIAPDGTPCGYQLKVGDIAQYRWRHEVRPEVEELLDVPIIHPAVDKRRPHRSFLVTTGNLADTVRREIDDRNEARLRDGRPILETVTQGQLLTAFTEAHGRFLPTQVGDLRLFFELYTQNGQYNLPKEKICRLLCAILPLDQRSTEAPSSKELERMVASALIVAAYILGPYERAGNHWAAAEGWLMTAAHVLGVHERFGTSAAATLVLLREALEAHLRDLRNEALSAETLFTGSMFDGVMLRYRLGILYGYLPGLQLWRRPLGRADDEGDERVVEFCARSSNLIRLPGESLVPYLLNAFWFLRGRGAEHEAKVLFEKIVEGVSRASSREPGLPNTYYDVELLARAYARLMDEPIDEDFEHRSFTMRSLLTVGARHGYRDVVAAEWRRISRLSCVAFYPDTGWQFFLWRAPGGEERSAFPEATQSWAALEAESQALVEAPELPAALKANPHFALFMPLVFPHRLRPDLVAFLDQRLLG